MNHNTEMKKKILNICLLEPIRVFFLFLYTKILTNFALSGIEVTGILPIPFIFSHFTFITPAPVQGTEETEKKA